MRRAGAEEGAGTGAGPGEGEGAPEGREVRRAGAGEGAGTGTEAGEGEGAPEEWEVRRAGAGAGPGAWPGEGEGAPEEWEVRRAGAGTGAGACAGAGAPEVWEVRQTGTVPAAPLLGELAVAVVAAVAPLAVDPLPVAIGAALAPPFAAGPDAASDADADATADSDAATGTPPAPAPSPPTNVWPDTCPGCMDGPAVPCMPPSRMPDSTTPLRRPLSASSSISMVSRHIRLVVVAEPSPLTSPPGLLPITMLLGVPALLLLAGGVGVLPTSCPPSKRQSGLGTCCAV